MDKDQVEEDSGRKIPQMVNDSDAKVSRLEKQKDFWEVRCLKAEKISDEVGQLNIQLQRKMLNCKCCFGSAPLTVMSMPDCTENVPEGVAISAVREALLTRHLTLKLQLSKFVSELTNILFTVSELESTTASYLDPIRMQFLIGKFFLNFFDSS